MGNVTLVLDEPTIFGNKKIRTGTAAMSSSYATNGDAIVGGWDQSLGMKVERIIMGGAGGSAGGVHLVPDLTNDKIEAFYDNGTATAAELPEATSTDDLSAAVAQFLAIGTVS